MKVLVAEDDKFLSKVYQTKLSKAGFEIQMAQDGEEALQALRSFVPDVILLDLMMPKKDGFQVLQAINADEKLKSIPVIVTSNLGQPEDKKKAMDLGAKSYIIKSDTPIQEIITKLQALAK